MDRKTFIKTTIRAFAVAVPAYALLSCSGSDDSNSNDPSGNDPNCLQNGTSSAISSNHGHSLTVSKDDVEAGIAKTYDIEGSAGHTHNVMVSAANFSSLQNNNQLNLVTTSGSGHTHNVTISCA